MALTHWPPAKATTLFPLILSVKVNDGFLCVVESPFPLFLSRMSPSGLKLGTPDFPPCVFLPFPGKIKDYPPLSLPSSTYTASCRRSPESPPATSLSTTLHKEERAVRLPSFCPVFRVYFFFPPLRAETREFPPLVSPDLRERQTYEVFSLFPIFGFFPPPPPKKPFSDRYGSRPSSFPNYFFFTSADSLSCITPQLLLFLSRRSHRPRNLVRFPPERSFLPSSPQEVEAYPSFFGRVSLFLTLFLTFFALA